MRHTPTAGFSLMEVLVGLTLLALISVSVGQTVRTGIAMWRASDKNNAAAELNRTGELVEDWIGRALPPGAFDRGEGAVFVGAPDQVSFLVDGRVGRKLLGYSRITLAARPAATCRAGEDLVLVWEDVKASGGYAAHARDTRTLVDCAESIRFEYAGWRRGEPGSGIARVSEWDGDGGLPEWVTLKVIKPGKGLSLQARLRYSE